MVERSELERLKATPIAGVALRLGLEPRRGVCQCPFHNERNGSFRLNARTNTYRCYGCGAHGNVIDLVMAMQNCDFLTAVRWLANESGVILTEYKPEPVARQAPVFDPSQYEPCFLHPKLCVEAERFLYDVRRLDPEVIRECRLTSYYDRAGKPWLQIPYLDPAGKLIGVQMRNLQPETGGPRFRFPPGSCIGLYGLPVLNKLTDGSELWLAEGCSDAWSHMSAHHLVLGIPSANLFGPQARSQLAELARRSITIRMSADQDMPGHKLLEEIRQVVPQLVEVPLPPGCKDYSDAFLAFKS